jgi:broad specificity phosphatase PhoE
MANQVHLVRHGEVENSNHIVYADLPGFGLSETGQTQAREAAEYLSSCSINAICSSPLTRAVQTATVIGEYHQIEIEIVDELTEFGLSMRWRGLRWEDLDHRFPGEIEAYLRHPWDMPFSPESLDEMAHRMKVVISDRHASYPDGDLVIVSHQDPVQAARLVLTNESLVSFTADKPAHAEVITLEPGTPWREVTQWEPSIRSGPFPPPDRKTD